MNNFQNASALFACERKAWGTNPFFAEAAFLHSQFDVLYEFGVRIQVEQRCKPAIKLASFFPPTLASQFPEILVLVRKGDAAAGYPSVNAEDARFEREVIYPRTNRIPAADGVVQVRDAPHIARTLFECD